MKYVRLALSALLMGALLSAAVATSLAQSAAQKSNAQMSFDRLKSLAGTWKGRLTVDPPQTGMGDEG